MNLWGQMLQKRKKGIKWRPPVYSNPETLSKSLYLGCSSSSPLTSFSQDFYVLTWNPTTHSTPLHIKPLFPAILPSLSSEPMFFIRWSRQLWGLKEHFMGVHEKNSLENLLPLWEMLRKLEGQHSAAFLTGWMKNWIKRGMTRWTHEK